MTSLALAKWLVAGYALLGLSLVLAALVDRVIGRADAHHVCPCGADDDAWLDDVPWDCLSADEQVRACERMWEATP